MHHSSLFVCIFILVKVYTMDYADHQELSYELTGGVIIFNLTMVAAFLGYCCVYGQMSHSRALLFTNLFSAIPFIGQDVVLCL